ncbi:MAG: glutamyl-tRNA reductase [Phycisphaerae bacterium]|jgi:glutamyl-tRNA reductase|nr:glutamyl-tRNA reductase [Phycisphaerae bacterium]
MKLSVIGISHRTAPVEVRERYALTGDLAGRFLRAAHSENVFEEAMVLDTCNRTELYFVPAVTGDCLDSFVGHVARLREISGEVDKSVFYRHDAQAAVEHLFSVAAALDSQIVGEHQILGQLKDAYRLASEERTARFLLNRLMHRAFRVGKRTQSETQLGRGSVSVASAAADLAAQIFSDMGDKTVLLVGAGQTAEAAARGLISAGVKRVVVANRTLSRAEELTVELAAAAADSDGDQKVRCPGVLRHSGGGAGAPVSAPDGASARAIELDRIGEVIGEVDMVICSTGSPDPVLTYDGLGDIISHRSKLLYIVDIAVPRDVDPKLGDLSNVFLHNLNDLDSVVARNIDRRRQEIPRAKAIVDFEVGEFVKWYDSLQVASTIKLLNRRFELLRQAEIKRYGGKFSDTDRQQLERFTQSLCKKILHRPITFLRELTQAASVSDQLLAVETILRMYELDELEAEQDGQADDLENDE